MISSTFPRSTRSAWVCQDQRVCDPVNRRLSTKPFMSRVVIALLILSHRYAAAKPAGVSPSVTVPPTSAKGTVTECSSTEVLDSVRLRKTEPECPSPLTHSSSTASTSEQACDGSADSIRNVHQRSTEREQKDETTKGPISNSDLSSSISGMQYSLSSENHCEAHEGDQRQQNQFPQSESEQESLREEDTTPGLASTDIIETSVDHTKAATDNPAVLFPFYISKARSKSKDLLQFISSLQIKGPAALESHDGESQKTDEEREVDDDMPTYVENPKQMLYKICRRIRAIRSSPDITLRIRSASVDDACVAAYSLHHMASQMQMMQPYWVRKDDKGMQTQGGAREVAQEFLEDRRLEQLVECVLCGLDVQRMLKKYNAAEVDTAGGDSGENGQKEDDDQEENGVERGGQEEDMSSIGSDSEEAAVEIGRGLGVSDASRAAWAISILLLMSSSSVPSTLGGEKVHDIISALGLRCRELLLAYYQQMMPMKRSYEHEDVIDHLFGDFSSFVATTNGYIENGQIDASSMSEEELANDASMALHAFATAEACVGIKSDADLVKICCLTLLSPQYFEQDKQQDTDVEQVGETVYSQCEEEGVNAKDGVSTGVRTLILDSANPTEADNSKGVENRPNQIDFADHVPNSTELAFSKSGADKMGKPTQRHNQTKISTSRSPLLVDYLAPPVSVQLLWALSVVSADPSSSREPWVQHLIDKLTRNIVDALKQQLVTDEDDGNKQYSCHESQGGVEMGQPLDNEEDKKAPLQVSDESGQTNLASRSNLETELLLEDEGEKGSTATIVVDAATLLAASSHTPDKAGDAACTATTTTINNTAVGVLGAEVLEGAQGNNRVGALNDVEASKDQVGLPLQYVVDGSSQTSSAPPEEEGPKHNEAQQKMARSKVSQSSAQRQAGTQEDHGYLSGVSIVENADSTPWPRDLDSPQEVRSATENGNPEVNGHVQLKCEDPLAMTAMAQKSRGIALSPSELVTLLWSAAELDQDPNVLALTASLVFRLIFSPSKSQSNEADSGSNDSKRIDSLEKLTFGEMANLVYAVSTVLRSSSRDAGNAVQWCGAEKIEEQQKLLVMSTVSEVLFNVAEQSLAVMEAAQTSWQAQNYVPDPKQSPGSNDSSRLMAISPLDLSLLISSIASCLNNSPMISTMLKEQEEKNVDGCSNLFVRMLELSLEMMYSNLSSFPVEDMVRTSIFRVRMLSVLFCESNGNYLVIGIDLEPCDGFSSVVLFVLLRYVSITVVLPMCHCNTLNPQCRMLCSYAEVHSIFESNDQQQLPPQFMRILGEIQAAIVTSFLSSSPSTMRFETRGLHVSAARIISGTRRIFMFGRSHLMAAPSDAFSTPPVIPIDRTLPLKLISTFPLIWTPVRPNTPLPAGMIDEILRFTLDALSLSAQNGKAALGQMHLREFVRLVWACAIISKSPHLSLDGREDVRRLFTMLVDLINESADETDPDGNPSLLDRTRTKDLSQLLWSLAELGVKGRSDTRSCAGIPKLTVKKPQLSPERLGGLSPTSSSNMLWGVVNVRDTNCDMKLLESLLLDIEAKATLLSPDDCCQTVISITKLRQILLEIVQLDAAQPMEASTNSFISNKEDSQNSIDDTKPLGTPNEAGQNDSDVEDSLLDAQRDQTDHYKLHDELFGARILSSRCDHMLAQLAAEIIPKLQDFSSSQLKVVVHAYVSNCFRADELIEAIGKEVESRLVALRQTFPSSSGDGSFISHVREASVANRLLKEMMNSTAVLSPLQDKKSKWNLLERMNTEKGRKTDKYKGEESISSAGADMNQTSWASLMMRLNSFEQGAHARTEAIFREHANLAAFELGCCQELVVAYRSLALQVDSDLALGTKEKIGKTLLRGLFQ